MERKPEIQYVGQFYMYGSEAKKLAQEERRQKARTMLPLERLRSIQEVCLDPVALFGIVVAVVMIVTMVIGAVHIQDAWDEYEDMQQYLTWLKSENARLSLEYSEGYNLAEVEDAALALGLVPIGEVKTIPVSVNLPEVVEEPSAWEQFKADVNWFIDGLFA